MPSRSQQPTLRSILAKNVRLHRQARGWSQELLAENASLTQVYVSRIESGSVAASIDTLEKLAAGFRIDAADLFKQTDSGN